MTKRMLPKLTLPWVLVDRDGFARFSFQTREEAIANLADTDRLDPDGAPHRAARLAVVEEAEPEPEVAPSGWRYERFDGVDGRWWVRSVDPESGDCVGNEYSANGVTIPPIDREYVARLLATRQEGDDE